MRILHTSDWHLGRYLLKTRQRYEEFESFLNFLAEVIETREVDCLIVAGDVFDTSTPSNRAQNLYYRFLAKLASSPVRRHVIIVAGNHDSPTFLEAPASLLSSLGVHVVGGPSIEREIIALSGASGKPELLVCAVPYLREGDLRKAVYEQSAEETRKTLAAALSAHYREIREAADKKLAELGAVIPVVAVGHLFLAGGLVDEGDGVREIHAGSLEALSSDSLPRFDYVALGHLHGPQKAGGSEMIRYSGSPLPMGFGEAARPKSLCLVDLQPGKEPVLELLPIPVFQKLARIKGDVKELIKGMRELEGTGAWLELIRDGGDMSDDPRARLEAEAERLGLEIIRIRDQTFRDLAMRAFENAGQDLADLEPEQVFEKLLDQAEIPEETRIELRATYAEVMAAMLEADQAAE